MKRDLATRNVARLAAAPKDEGRAKVVKALTVERVDAVLDGLDGTRWHPVIALGFATGLRPGELLALHWSDVHLDGRQPHLTVRYSMTHVGGAALKAPKVARSNRTVPIPPEVMPVLKAWRRQQAAERLAAGPLWSTEWDDLVFTTEAGEPTRVDVLRQGVQRTLRPHRLTHFHPHQARHTYATHLIERGVPIAHVAELLGDTVATIEGNYSHVMRPKHEVADVVSGLFARA
jgi:integrase